MANRLGGMSVMALMSLVVLVAAGVVGAESNCPTLIPTMAPCLSFVTGGDTTPSTACCTALTNVVNTNFTCLCDLLSASSGLNVNVTRALELPALCNVNTPPVSSCNLAEAPASAPSPETGDSTDSAPPPVTIPFPIPGGNTNAGELFAPSMVMIVSMVCVVLMKVLS